MINEIEKIIILIIIFTIIFFIYKKKFHDILIIDLPYSLGCLFKRKHCENGFIDELSLIYIFIFFIIGLIYPNKYVIVFVISIIFELIQPYLTRKPRYIIGPLVNFIGYMVGSLIGNKLIN